MEREEPPDGNATCKGFPDQVKFIEPLGSINFETTSEHKKEKRKEKKFFLFIRRGGKSPSNYPIPSGTSVEVFFQEENAGVREGRLEFFFLLYCALYLFLGDRQLCLSVCLSVCLAVSFFS
jgi:hypothetical protein